MKIVTDGKRSKKGWELSDCIKGRIMSKHTPGPWYKVGNGDYDTAAISTDPIDNSIKHEVLGSSEWLRATPEDLTLMAAAPEMLEALEFFMIEAGPSGAGLDGNANLYDLVKNAIKKAKGE
jgi:hypothetical protein